MSQLGEKVKKARKAQKMTQKELAEGICTQATISNLEKGESFPSIAIIATIAERLGLDLSEIYEESSSAKGKYNEVFDRIRLLFIQCKHAVAYKVILDEIEFEKLNLASERKLYFYYLAMSNLIGVSNFKEALYYFDLALLEEEQELNFTDVLILNGIGAGYTMTAEIEKAQTYFGKAIKLLNHLLLSLDFQDYGSDIARVYYNTAKFYSQIEHYQQAIDYCELGINIQKEQSSFYYLDALFYEKGFNLMKLEKFEDAEEFYCYAATIARINTNDSLIEVIQANMEDYGLEGYKYW